MTSKINQLLKQWPKGTVATGPWLQEHGVYRQLARRYVASGWIQSLGRGVFLRTGDTVDWFGGVYALQAQLRLSVYAGGTTALSLKGLGYHIPLGDKTAVSLFSERGERLPAWFTARAWGVRIQHHSLKLFESSEPVGFTDVQHGEFSVRVSAPERAILETLHLATTKDEILYAVELFGGLSTLRPQVLQALLEGCRSVKVKRLFLWAAEAAGHEWRTQLVTERLDLGTGKRSVYPGGQFDSKYQITVPKREETAHA
jgi:hypothetical protein